ncbi:MAG: acetyl ornithine aminotransferase family protein [Elusimicrobia bacterium]|nr:acetyl ornithine aminotransferase family protein [Elusimicrobiota bacterium]
MNQKNTAGPKAKAWVARDERVISSSYTRSYPAVIVRGRGLKTWDADGREYLDFSAGIAVVATGHCHPRVVRAIQKQAAELIHMSGTDFYYPSQIRLAEKLSEIFPGKEKAKIFYGNSGTEAIEAGMKLARWKTRRPRYLAFTSAFHGRTFGSLSLTNSKAVQREGFGPLLPQVDHAPFAYCYRCPLNLKYPSCKIACADYIEDEIFRTRVPAEEVAAIVVEPIQGEGGYVVPPPEWLVKIKKIAEKHGMLLIADEVQSGMGRTGKMFAVEHFKVNPDMIALAKGIASGMPLGVLLARASLMTWPPGAHASTFGGNPVSSEAALVTIELIEKQLMQNAREQGKYFIRELKKLQKEFEVIGDVRGLGLMIGVELVKDRETKERAPELRSAIVEACFEKGLLILGCGPNTLRLCPPLTAARKDIDRALGILRAAFKQKTEQPKGPTANGKTPRRSVRHQKTV